MKRTFASMVLLVLVSMASLAQTGSATPTPNPGPTTPTATATGVKVGVIDTQGAIAGSNEGQRDFEALAKKFEINQHWVLVAEVTDLDKKVLNEAVQALKEKGLFAEESKRPVIEGMTADLGLSQETAAKLDKIGQEQITGATLAHNAENKMELHVELKSSVDGVKRGISAMVDMGGNIDYKTVAPLPTQSKDH